MPGELNYKAWSDAPVSAQFLAFGNATMTGTTEEIQAWFYDVKNASAPAVVGRVYHGDANEEQTRRFAHQFADEICPAFRRRSRMSPRKSLSSAAAAVTRKSGRWITTAPMSISSSLHSIALTPRWSPDATGLPSPAIPSPDRSQRADLRILGRDFAPVELGPLSRDQ